MSEASGINVSINTNKEEQEEKEVQPEQGDDEGLVNESEGEDEEKQSTSAGNASSRPPQVQVKAVSHSRERNGNESVRLENNRQKARDTRKRRKIMLGEMKRRIVSLQKVNKELQEKNTALQDALDRALQECEAKSQQQQHQMLWPHMTSHNTDYNTIRGTHDFSPRVINNNENILSRQTQQLIAQIENRHRRDTDNLMFPHGRPSNDG